MDSDLGDSTAHTLSTAQRQSIADVLYATVCGAAREGGIPEIPPSPFQLAFYNPNPPCISTVQWYPKEVLNDSHFQCAYAIRYTTSDSDGKLLGSLTFQRSSASEFSPGRVIITEGSHGSTQFELPLGGHGRAHVLTEGSDVPLPELIADICDHVCGMVIDPLAVLYRGKSDAELLRAGLDYSAVIGEGVLYVLLGNVPQVGQQVLVERRDFPRELQKAKDALRAELWESDLALRIATHIGIRLPSS